MSLVRLKARTPSAVRLGTFILNEHQLCFHKASDDGSGKCDVINTKCSDDKVIGAIFEIDEKEKVHLDRAEGLGYGYDEKEVTVHNECGESLEAFIYYAIKIDPSLKPYSWYLNHVVIGAKEIAVAPHYLKQLESTQTTEDPDKERDAKQREIYRHNN
jgi:hypothetical protein